MIALHGGLHALQALLCNPNKWLRQKLRQAPTATGEFLCGNQTADCAQVTMSSDPQSPPHSPEHHQTSFVPAISNIPSEVHRITELWGDHCKRWHYFVVMTTLSLQNITF
jgi:hypothetical protein